MKIRNPDAHRVVKQNLSPESESMQMYSNEGRKRMSQSQF
jgi:hypothetical protein